MARLNAEQIAEAKARIARKAPYTAISIPQIPLAQARQEAEILPDFVGEGRPTIPCHTVIARLDGTPDIVPGTTLPTRSLRRGRRPTDAVQYVVE